MLQPYTPDDLAPATAFPEVYGHTPQRSLLERVLAPLDWGRQAVVGAGEGLGAIGQGHIGTGLAKLLPAIGGIGAGLLGGPLVGTGVASLLQGLGGEVAPDTFDSMGTQDLVRKLGGDPESTWQNLGVGAVTDPWMYAMGASGLAAGTTKAGQIGERVGASAGAKAGRWLEQAQLARGPRYPTTPNDLAAMLGINIENLGAELGIGNQWVNGLGRAAAEVPPGSTVLPGTGGANVLRTPAGNVIKFDSAGALLDYSGGRGIPIFHGRPVSEGLVQPYRSMVGGYTFPQPMVEHMPFASPLPETETRAAHRAMQEAHGPIARRVGEGFGPSPIEVLGPQHHLAQGLHPEEAAFQAMLREGTWDSGPRQVYADWLEEAGRPMDGLRQRHIAEVFDNLMASNTPVPMWQLEGNWGNMGTIGGKPKLLSPGDLGSIRSPRHSTRILDDIAEIRRIQASPDFAESMYAMDPAYQQTAEQLRHMEEVARSRIVPRQPVTIGRDPTALQSRLLEALGGDARLQAALEAGHQNTGLIEYLTELGRRRGGQGMSVTGGLLGAGLGGGLPVATRGGLGY